MTEHFQSRSKMMALIGASTLMIAGCTDTTDQSAEADLPSAQQSPDDNDTIGDPETGVSSTGEVFTPNVSSDRSEQVFAGFDGSGQTLVAAKTIESEDEYEKLLALPPLTAGGVSAEIIHGTDDRKKVVNTGTFPQRAQVLIALPGGRCSGAMVGKDLVLTAGHCVHSGGKNGNWYRSATVYPGRNGRAAPFGSCTAKRFYSVRGWTVSRDSNYDFGAIKLNCDIGNRVGWMGFYYTPNSLDGVLATISSYPGDKPLEQWVHADPVKKSGKLKSYYYTDTVGGNSGSGVFATKNVPAGCKGPCVHTVHAYGGSLNSGTRISSPLFDNLMAWRKAP